MKYMRDSFLESVYQQMSYNGKIFVLSADVGAPALDKIRKDYPSRFINTGIAEQNTINVATGLAMEGYQVYVYGIAAFFLRAADQIRNSLLLYHQYSPLNINILSTGKGISYETAGPTHHCLEDLPVFSAFPGFEIYVPSDATMARAMAAQLIQNGVRYFCCDGKKVALIYNDDFCFDLSDGYITRNSGEKSCIVTMGGMLSFAEEILKVMRSKGIEIGLIDLFTPTEFDKDKLLSILNNYSKVITLEEGYREEGVLSVQIQKLITGTCIKLHKFGFDRKYIFEPGPREMHYKNAGITINNIVNVL